MKSLETRYWKTENKGLILHFHLWSYCRYKNVIGERVSQTLRSYKRSLVARNSIVSDYPILLNSRSSQGSPKDHLLSTGMLTVIHFLLAPRKSNDYHSWSYLGRNIGTHSKILLMNYYIVCDTCLWISRMILGSEVALNLKTIPLLFFPCSVPASCRKIRVLCAFTFLYYLFCIVSVVNVITRMYTFLWLHWSASFPWFSVGSNG